MALAISSEEMVVPSKRNVFRTQILKSPHPNLLEGSDPLNTLPNVKLSPRDLLWKADRTHWMLATEAGVVSDVENLVAQVTEAACVKAGLKRSREGMIEGCIVID